jgi:serine/threonine-protein kinase
MAETQRARLAIGSSLAQFRITGVLGEGGMGVVYEATDEKLRRTVAIKVLPEGFARDEERRARFLREARSLAAVTHGNIATVYDVGDADGRLFIVMERVEGRSLRDLLGEGPLPLPRALHVARGVARGLTKAHEKGVVHRDLKPDNVMLTDDGEVKILDFGLAKLLVEEASRDAKTLAHDQTALQDTEEGRVLGTPGYMSPEQTKGQGIDLRTDIFSFGVVLYEMLAGDAPFHGATSFDVLVSVTRDRPDPVSSRNPSVPPALEALVERCLAKSPMDRFGTARELLVALEGIRVTADNSAPPPPSVAAPPHSLAAQPPRSLQPRSTSTKSGTALSLQPTNRRRRALVVGATGAVVAVGVVAAALLVPRGKGRDRPQPPASASAGTIASSGAAQEVAESSNPEANAAYRDALAAVRGGNTRACAQFERAATLDPGFAAAHLRHADCFIGNLAMKARDDFRQAGSQRDRLSARDQAWLDALEPVFQRQPADYAESIARFERALVRFPEDVDLLTSMALLQLGVEAPKNLDTIHRALAIDPHAAELWAYDGWYHAYSGDFEGARESFAHCLDVAPGATKCLQMRILLQSQEGQCASVEADARHWLAIDNESGAYLALAESLYAQRRPVESVREALRDAERAQEGGDFNRRSSAISLAKLDVLRGDFTSAARTLEEAAHAVDASRFEADHAVVVDQLVQVYAEAGQVADARRVAQDFLARRDAWEPDPVTDDWALDRDPTGPTERALVHAGTQKAADAWAHLDARATWWHARVLPSWHPYVWLDVQARGADDEDSGRRAIAALENGTVPPFNPLVPADARAGAVFALAGRSKEAVLHLDRAVHACDAVGRPIEHVRAYYYLGLAREQDGDRKGACAAYAGVIERWKDAKPRSVTYEKAAVRARTLRCGG